MPREVALKLMPFGSADLEEMLRHRNEIATLASLNHPALVTLFDAGTEKFSTEKSPAAERTFLVMELVDGPNLRQLLAKPLPHDQVAYIAADVAEALHYMHDKGIVHRDIKPANILLAPSALPDRAVPSEGRRPGDCQLHRFWAPYLGRHHRRQRQLPQPRTGTR